MKWLRVLLLPVACIYGIVVNLRNILYDKGILSSRTFKTPLICIGNLSLGGTGKTPMTEFLVNNLKDEQQLAILSRGYKRKSKGLVLANKESSVEDLGDEPFQMFKKFPDVPLVVNADRAKGIDYLEKHVQPKAIILDDAYQHRKVTPSFSILLTTYHKPFDKDFYLPTGYLRDAKMASKRANVIVVTKCPNDATFEELHETKKRIAGKTGKKVLLASLKYGDALIGVNKIFKISELNSGFTLVTAIADPRPLVDHLKGLGLEFEHQQFNDHHFFSDEEVLKLQKSKLLITTEKDFGRLDGKVENLYYLKMQHEFLEDGRSELLTMVRKAI